MVRRIRLSFWSSFLALLLTLVAGWSGLKGFSMRASAKLGHSAPRERCSAAE
jgi:hypothetical protein